MLMPLTAHSFTPQTDHHAVSTILKVLSSGTSLELIDILCVCS